MIAWLSRYCKQFMMFLGRYRIIYDRHDKKPYLERYYLLFRDRNVAPFNIFLHKFLKSDPDELHDHPWNYRTVILYGGYWEHTVSGKQWLGAGCSKFSKAESMHRIELDKNHPVCWTLFRPYKKSRSWGFMQNASWVAHDSYEPLKKNVMQNKNDIL